MTPPAAVLLLLAATAPALRAARMGLMFNNEMSAEHEGQDLGTAGALTNKTCEETWAGSHKTWAPVELVAWKNQEKCLHCTNKCSLWCPDSLTCALGNKVQTCRPFGEAGRAHGCKTTKQEWVLTMEAMHGAGWATNYDMHMSHHFHLEVPRYGDSLACISWAIGAPLWPSSEHIGDTKEEKQLENNLGIWACTSALVRHGLMASLGKLPPEQTGTVTGNQNQKTWVPAICRYIKLKTKNKDCYVSGHMLSYFDSLRTEVSQPNAKNPGRGPVGDEMAGSLDEAPLVSFDPGAGKSGSGFSMSGDGTVAVKLGLKIPGSYSKWKMNEPKYLTYMLLAYEGPSLIKHFATHSDSLLNRIHAMTSYAFTGTTVYTVALADAYYGKKGQIPKQYFKEGKARTYDLKGASRSQSDKAEEGSSTLSNGDFTEREPRGRLQLSKPQCDKLLQVVMQDTAFLASHKIIDYSLLVMAVDADVQEESGETASCAGTPGEPYCMENNGRVYTFNIIDYLNRFTVLKRLESVVVKLGKFWEYRRKIDEYVAKICPGEGPAWECFNRGGGCKWDIDLEFDDKCDCGEEPVVEWADEEAQMLYYKGIM